MYPALSAPQFFPGKSWEEIQSMLFDALSVVVEETLSSRISQALSSIDFSFIAYLGQTNYPVSKCRDQLFEFLMKLLAKNEARKAFGGPFSAIKLGISDRYIDLSFVRREYVHFELVKVQKLKMGKDEIKNLVKTALFLKPAIHILTTDNTMGNQRTTSDVIQKQFADKAVRALETQLRLIPPLLLKTAVDSNLSFMDNPNLETTSRIVSIFASRCRNFAVLTNIERGAEHPDKSWFNIARKNYKHYGFDIMMLDEFYKIATENGW